MGFWGCAGYGDTAGPGALLWEGLACSQAPRVSPAFLLKPVPLKINSKQNNNKKPQLPICIPLTAVLAAWPGCERTNSSSPRLAAAQPPLTDLLRLRGLGAHSRQHRAGVRLPAARSRLPPLHPPQPLLPVASSLLGSPSQLQDPPSPCVQAARCREVQKRAARCREVQQCAASSPSLPQHLLLLRQPRLLHRSSPVDLINAN